MIYLALKYAVAVLAGATLMGWAIVLLTERARKLPQYDHDGIDYELRRDIEDWGRLPRSDWQPSVNEPLHRN